MKALIIAKKNRIKRFLVEIHTDDLVKEIAILIGREKYSKAATVLLAKGRIEKEISEKDLKDTKADILLETGAL